MGQNLHGSCWRRSHNRTARALVQPSLALHARAIAAIDPARASRKTPASDGYILNLGRTPDRHLHPTDDSAGRIRATPKPLAHARARALSAATWIRMENALETSHPDAAPNAEQIEYWNGPVGQRWLAYNDWLDERTAAYGRVALVAAAARPGEAVLDIGCGAGATAFELARAVGPSGAVTGVDISAPLLSRARERAAALGLPVEFREADASRPTFAPHSFDLLFSRFGVMFFDDPAAAFAELRKTLKPGGRLAFACWQDPRVNDWYELPLAAIEGIVERAPVDTRQPGPFAFSEPERLRAILAEAGFAGIELAPFATPFYLGRGADREAMADDAMEQVFRVGPIARLLEAQDEDTQARARAAIRAALLKLAGDDGLDVGGAIWVVTARAS